MAERGPVEPLIRLRGAASLAGRSETDWRERQLAELSACLASRRGDARAAHAARWSAWRERADRDRRWLARERRQLRGAFGLDPVRTWRTVARDRRLRRDRRVTGTSVILERWRIRGRDGLVAAALRLAPPESDASVILIPGAQGLDVDKLRSRWINPLLDAGIAVLVLGRVDRSTDDPVCRRAAGKDRRRVLHRLGFGIGRTPEGLEIEAIGALLRAVRRRSPAPARSPHPVALLGVDGGARLATLAAVTLGGITALGLDESHGPDLDRAGGPVDERLHGSATLPAGDDLLELRDGAAVVPGLRTARPIADALGVGARTRTRSPGPDPLPEDWARVELRALFRAWEGRLRRELERAARIGARR